MQSLENLNIDTPEQIALELPLAGIGSRFFALALDSLLQFVAVVALFIVLALTSSELRYLGLGSLGPVAAIVVPFCIYWGYFAFFEILWKGQTPGKRYAGIRVIKQSGRPMNAIEAIGRNLMRGIDIVPGIYSVGLVCMMCNQQHKRLGDFVAGTVVVHDKAIDSVNSSWTAAPPAAAASATQAETTKLTTDELVLIETYLSRRYEIDPTIRFATAQRIVALVQEKTGILKPSDQSDDDFLEAMARQVRDTARFR
ncbi:MAG: RDD family protein [Acidobacteria bacterium]|nr:RDD family protein [Acidobacteriota bacterium]